MNDFATPLRGKLYITGRIVLLTGLHIGASSDFSAIGAVDMVVVRDPLSRVPIIPGSSLKGKMRSLLARNIEGGPFLDINREPEQLKRLFGCSKGKDKSDRIIPARLQFVDLFMNDESAKRIEEMFTDLHLTEIKFENTINRMTGEAKPRQMERVPAGAEFYLRLVYNIEDTEQLKEDMELLAQGLKLLQLDYLGKGGTRGNGRIAFRDLDVRLIAGKEDLADLPEIRRILQEAVEGYVLLPA